MGLDVPNGTAIEHDIVVLLVVVVDGAVGDESVVGFG